MFSVAIMRQLATLWLSLLLLSCNEEPKLKARVNLVVGEVRVESANSASKLASIGDLLLPNDQITTSASSSIDLLLPGGSVLRLKESSNLLLADLSAQTNLNLKRGDLLMAVKRMKSNETLQITTPTVVAAVRGTSFSISNVSNTIAVLTGKLLVQRDGESVITESMKQVNTDEKRLSTTTVSQTKVNELKEILSIHGVDSLDDYNEMQKNWATTALNSESNALPIKRTELPSLQVKEK